MREAAQPLPIDVYNDSRADDDEARRHEPGWQPRPRGEPRARGPTSKLVITAGARVAAPSTTRIKGRLAIRVNLTNHRTIVADLELLVEAVVRIGKEMMVVAGNKILVRC